MKNFFVSQKDINDCGIASLAMIFNIYGINKSYDDIKKEVKLSNDGISALDIINVSNKNGMEAIGYKNYDINNFKNPFIAHLINDNKKQHFVVVLKVVKDKVLIADPSSKEMYVDIDWFNKHYTKIAIIFKKNNNLSIKDIFKNKKIIISLTLITIILSLFNILSSYILSLLIDLLSANIKFKIIFGILLAILFLDLLKELLFLIRNKLSIKFQIFVDKVITMPTIKKILSLPHDYYQNNGTGSLMSKLNDLYYVKEMILKFVEIIIVNLIFSSISLLFLFFINKIYALINMFLISIVIFINMISFKKYFFKTYDLQIKNEELNNDITDAINNILTIKNLSKEKFFYKNILSRYSKFLEDSKDLNYIHLKRDLIQNIFIVFSNIIIIYFSLSKSIGTIFFIITLEEIIFESIRSISNNIPLFLNYKSVLSRVEELFKMKEMDYITNNLNIKSILFKNVNYKYDKTYVLKNCNMTIKDKDWIMITGESGSGKSTLMKLLTKQIISKGIYINGRNIKDFSKEEITKAITYVNQKTKLFSKTIKENIELGNKANNIVLNTSLVDELIKNKNLDYNYLVDNTNSNLSGGQIQKILIAQTLCNSGNIIIFDETTSEIDTESERRILTNIKKNFKNKTIILITHRTENKDLFNKVLYLDKGKLINKK